MQKRLIALTAMLAMSSASAITQEDIESCEVYQQFANDVMIIRQFDTPMAEAKQIMRSTYQPSMSKEAEASLNAIIDASYAVELRDTPDDKKQAVLDFRKAIYRNCMGM